VIRPEDLGCHVAPPERAPWMLLLAKGFPIVAEFEAYDGTWIQGSAAFSFAEQGGWATIRDRLASGYVFVAWVPPECKMRMLS
jgi:hypothetical protein